ncbi:hypothetical protein Vadar_008575 [Vaccinium darrowii]|uniref:Uncharacterized protein n=1 Tax=Vaccinium darrowii TaxID=229202 RepID=A0ACB7XG48_9ERIC|nr:hypothetical protein Vadar_008575 [Vaccinium darrowii]
MKIPKACAGNCQMVAGAGDGADGGWWLDVIVVEEGEFGKPGLIRCCDGTVPSPSSGDEKLTLWCHEKLLAIDPVERW